MDTVGFIFLSYDVNNSFRSPSFLESDKLDRDNNNGYIFSRSTCEVNLYSSIQFNNSFNYSITL